jgi:hypothetical protein
VGWDQSRLGALHLLQNLVAENSVGCNQAQFLPTQTLKAIVGITPLVLLHHREPIETQGAEAQTETADQGPTLQGIKPL